jgi:hypothetical protein
MSLDVATGKAAPATHPLQFINIEITPLIDGKYYGTDACHHVAVLARLLPLDSPTPPAFSTPRKPEPYNLCYIGQMNTAGGQPFRTGTSLRD